MININQQISTSKDLKEQMSKIREEIAKRQRMINQISPKDTEGINRVISLLKKM